MTRVLLCHELVAFGRDLEHPRHASVVAGRIDEDRQGARDLTFEGQDQHRLQEQREEDGEERDPHEGQEKASAAGDFLRAAAVEPPREEGEDHEETRGEHPPRFELPAH